MQSPFFGISLIEAVKKLWERLFRLTQYTVYLWRGTRNNRQFFLIKPLLMPSGPAAVLVRVSLTALSNSSIEISLSNCAAVALLIFIPVTIGEAVISGPKKSSIQPFKSFIWVGGSLYKFS